MACSDGRRLPLRSNAEARPPPSHCVIGPWEPILDFYAQHIVAGLQIGGNVDSAMGESAAGRGRASLDRHRRALVNIDTVAEQLGADGEGRTWRIDDL